MPPGGVRNIKNVQPERAETLPQPVPTSSALVPRIKPAAPKPEPLIPNPRPRDAAIRKAANDNRVPANDNTRGAVRTYGRPTTDEQFRYSYSQKGLQPSVGAVMPYRNVNVATTYEGASQPNAPIRELALETATAPQQTNEQNKRRIQNLSPRQRQEMQANLKEGLQTARNPRRLLRHPKKALMGFVPGELRETAERAFAISVSVEIISWAMWVYLVQLIFALLAILFLGISAGVEAADSFTFGLLPDSLNPEPFFILCTIVALACGYITLFIMSLNYALVGVPALSGQGSGTKLGSVLLAYVGYSLPFLNLFPWAIFWILAVIYYPTDEAS